MTKDEVDEWMRQRGFVSLENLGSLKAPRRRSPEELEKIRLWLERGAESLCKVVEDILAKRITREEGRTRLHEAGRRDAEELGIKLPDSTDECNARRVRDVDSTLGSVSPGSAEEEQVKAH